VNASPVRTATTLRIWPEQFYQRYWRERLTPAPPPVIPPVCTVWSIPQRHRREGYARAIAGDTFGVIARPIPLPALVYSALPVVPTARLCMAGHLSNRRALGVSGESSSAGGIGVWGYDRATSGQTYVMAGGSIPLTARREGLCHASSGSTYGVVGQADSLTARRIRL